MSKVLTFLIVFYSLSADLIGEVQLVGSFSSFETYYIGMIDLETGTTNVPLFNFTVQDPNLTTPYNPLIEFHAQFKFEIHSPELGFNIHTFRVFKRSIAGKETDGAFHTHGDAVKYYLQGKGKEKIY